MNSKGRGIGLYIIIFIILIGTVGAWLGSTSPERLIYTDVIDLFERAQVREFIVEGQTLKMTLQDGTKKEFVLPSVELFRQDLGELIDEQRASGIIRQYNYLTPQGEWILTLIPTILMIGLIVVMFLFMIRRQESANKQGMSFGQSRAKLFTPDEKKTTFGDVAGADEEKAELVEIIDFLRDPRKYAEIGARVPKGVLLVGLPGTGKTLLAKAVAGEANVPFFSISGSDFLELYVGVGAARVRDLFDKAKRSAPSIVFIDEIDAVGRQRGTGLGGGHDEREQTLNQLLVEMDGFSGNMGVTIIAATNRADILDPALLRPGRFDRQVYINLPDAKGRREILNVHARRKPFENDVDFDGIARATPGFAGADLENLLNEAALFAARRNKKRIGRQEIDDAMLKVSLGTEKKSRTITEQERRLTAYHEAGHALVTRLLPSLDPVFQVSIIPRGRAGGFTMYHPRDDKYTFAKSEMCDRLVALLGGRVAERTVLGDLSTGASQDIEQATKIARSMVTKYGMSDKLGPVVFGSDHDEVFLGRDFATSKNFSDETAALIDSEIKALIDNAYERCETLILEHMDQLTAISEYLLAHETMDAETFEQVFLGKVTANAAQESGPAADGASADAEGRAPDAEGRTDAPPQAEPDGQTEAEPDGEEPAGGRADAD